MTNKSYLVLRVSTAVRMEGRTVKEMSETDKQVKKGLQEAEMCRKLYYRGKWRMRREKEVLVIPSLCRA